MHNAQFYYNNHLFKYGLSSSKYPIGEQLTRNSFSAWSKWTTLVLIFYWRCYFVNENSNFVLEVHNEYAVEINTW